MTRPRIDGLAADGMRFSDAHSPSSLCSPTRYALLTGRYGWRTWLRMQVLSSYSRPLIASDRGTLGAMLGARGYRTAAVGKWHLGMGFSSVPEGEKTAMNDCKDFTAPVLHGPVDRGFERFFGVSANLGWPPFVTIRDDRFTAVPSELQPGADTPKVRGAPRAAGHDLRGTLDRLTEEAVTLIEESAETDALYFLYFPPLMGKVADNAASDHIRQSSLRYYRESLRADRNRIRDLGPLAGLPGLVRLDAGGNRIGDFSALEGNRTLRVLGTGEQNNLPLPR